MAVNSLFELCILDIAALQKITKGDQMHRLIANRDDSLWHKIGAVPLAGKPFPHYSVNDLFSQSDFERMRALRPTYSEYMPEPHAPGRYWIDLVSDNRPVVPFKDELKREFWTAFVREKIPTVIAATIKRLERLLGARFSGVLEGVEIAQLAFLETDPDYMGHAVQTHYYHSPDWLFTSFIYLDDGDQTTRGVQLYRFADQTAQFNDEICNSLSFTWEHMSHVAKDELSKFVPNSMLAFFESPMSIYGLPNIHPKQTQNRRTILRLNVRGSNEVFQRLYGCSRIDFFALYKNRHRASPFFDGVRRDFEVIRDVHKGVIDLSPSDASVLEVKSWNIAS